MRHAWGLLLLSLLAGCLSGPLLAGDAGTDTVSQTVLRQLSPMPSLPADPTNRFADDDRAADLGFRLFFDPALSRDGQHSCSSCHQPDKAFTDGLETATALAPGTRNTPTLLNAAFQRWQGWAGKADTIWLQSLNALEDPKEQGAKRLAVVYRLRMVHKEPYEAIFGALPPDSLPHDGHPGEPAFDALSPDAQEQVNRAVVNVGKSLEAYIRKLVTGPAPFDRYVAGDKTALSAQAVHGLALFTGKANCIACHSGSMFSDGDFHNLGIPAGHVAQEDTGRFEDLQRLLANPRNGNSPWSDAPQAFPLAQYQSDASQRHQFKTPSLRNVALTAPYWHNGAGSNALESVIGFEMAGGGPGVAISFAGTVDPKLVPHPVSYADSQAIKAFLESLTGAPPPQRWTAPPSTWDWASQ